MLSVIEVPPFKPSLFAERAKNGSIQFVFSGGKICVSLAPYATDNFISGCPVEYLVSFVRYVCLKYLPFWAGKSNNIFPYPLWSQVSALKTPYSCDLRDFRAQCFASRSMHSVNISSLDTVFLVCITPLVEAWIKSPCEFLIRYAVRFDVG